MWHLSRLNLSCPTASMMSSTSFFSRNHHHDMSINICYHILVRRFTSNKNISSAACSCLSCLQFLSSTRRGVERSFLMSGSMMRPHSTNSTSTSGLVDEGPNAAINSLLSNNKKWVENMRREDPDYFVKNGAIEKPSVLYIGCSDSPISPNEALQLKPGEVFVHRNLGNILVVTDLNALSVLEYAVEHLDCQDIIVAGHYDCGAVRAAMKQQDLGLLENWLRNIRDVYRLHGNFLDMIDDDELRHRSLVEMNVYEQCLNIAKTGVVQRKQIANSRLGKSTYPRIHPLVFDPVTGLMKRIVMNPIRQTKSYNEIYSLYSD